MVLKGMPCQNFNGIVGYNRLRAVLTLYKVLKFYSTENAFLGLSQEGRQLQSVEILRRLLFHGCADRRGEVHSTGVWNIGWTCSV